jgi:hypothetical protein
MAKFRKKPVVIEAVQFVGTNYQEIFDFCKDASWHEVTKNTLWILTLEGGHIASLGDFIIKGVKNEFYPCKPDIFEQTYEAVDATQR